MKINRRIRPQYYTTAQLSVHVRNHDLICDKKKCVLQQFFLQDYD